MVVFYTKFKKPILVEMNGIYGPTKLLSTD